MLIDLKKITGEMEKNNHGNIVVECTPGILYMDFLSLKQKFPGTLGVWIVGTRSSGICSAFWKDGNTDLIPMLAGVGCM